MWNLRPVPARVAGLLLVALLLGGCTGGDGTTSAQARVDAILQVREQVVTPAQALGTAAAEVAGRLDEVVARPADATVGATRSALDDLVDARGEVASLDLDADTEDVRAAADALDDAVTAAQDVEEASRRVLEAAEVAAEVDERLAELVAAWDEPGSRSQLIARFEDVAAAAEQLADDEVTTAPACPGPVAARRDAAEFVAQATRELTELVRARDGLAFDERRAELAEAPFGIDEAGVVRGPGASIDPASCPAVAEVEDAAARVADALRTLQQALNPDDLSG